MEGEISYIYMCVCVCVCVCVCMCVCVFDKNTDLCFFDKLQSIIAQFDLVVFAF